MNDRGSVRGQRVLVVDDDADTCELYAIALGHEGHVVTAAFDGESALARMTSEPFDVALIDLALVGLDGLAVARAARDALGERTPYLVAISGYGSPAHRSACEDAGFDEHHLKPVPPDELLSMVGRAHRRPGHSE